MTSLAPSISADGLHFEEQTEIAMLARQFSAEDGHPAGLSREHWQRAEREFHVRHRLSVPVATPVKESAADARVEEAMHLDQ